MPRVRILGHFCSPVIARLPIVKCCELLATISAIAKYIHAQLHSIRMGSCTWFATVQCRMFYPLPELLVVA